MIRNILSSMLFRKKSLLLLVSRLLYGFLGNLIQGLTIYFINFFFLLTMIKCTRLLMIAHGKSIFSSVLLLNNSLLNNLVRESLMIKFWAAMKFQEKSLPHVILSQNYGVLDNVIHGCLIFVLSLIICIRKLTVFQGKSLFLSVLWLNYSL